MSGSPPAALPAPWGVHELGGAGEVRAEIGPLTLRLVEREGEIRAIREARAGEEAEWTRWAPARWDGRISLTPVFPDRPFVIHPETTFWLVRGAEARIYVRIPLWVHVEALGEAATSLARIPTVAHFDTWWGTLDQGELCYWMETAAKRSLEGVAPEPHVAFCPVQLVNRSSDSLQVEKIALRVAHLSLFLDGDRFWSDETRVTYEGEAEGTELDVSGAAPREAPRARLVAGPRLRMGRGFRTLTFARRLQEWI